MKKLRADWRLSQRSEVVSFVEGLSVLEMTEGIYWTASVIVLNVVGEGLLEFWALQG